MVSKRQPDAAEIQDLMFAWSVAQFVKSNAIVYCKNQQTIGIGAGQMSRVYSAKIAGIKRQTKDWRCRALLWLLTPSSPSETALTPQRRQASLPSYSPEDLFEMR